MSLLRTNGSNKKKKHGGISLNNSNLSTPLISPSRNTHEHRNKRKSHNKKMGIFAKQRESKEKARNLWGKFRRDTGGLGLGKAAFKSSSLSSLINSIDVNKTKVNIPSNDMESKGGDHDENDKMEQGVVIEERDKSPPKSMRELLVNDHKIEHFVTSFDTYEKHHKHKKGEIEDVTKQHEMELRILNTNPGKLEEITKLKNIATVTHDKHKVVKQILEDRATMADTEKKIYGVDTQIKDALIRSLRNAKVRLEGQLKLKDAAVMKHQKTIMNVNRESRRLSNINETLRYEMKKRQLRTRATSAPPPPPPPQEKIVEDAVSEILAISFVPKEPPMPPAEEEDERSRLSSSPVDEALL